MLKSILLKANGLSLDHDQSKGGGNKKIETQMVPSLGINEKSLCKIMQTQNITSDKIDLIVSRHNRSPLAIINYIDEELCPDGKF